MITDIIITALLVTGGMFGLIGSFGLLKLDDPMKRLHAPTKATTVGVGAVLLSSVIFFSATQGQVTWHEVLIVLFLFVTSPVTALFLAKLHLHQNRRNLALPASGTGRDWATLDTTPPGDAH